MRAQSRIVSGLAALTLVFGFGVASSARAASKAQRKTVAIAPLHTDSGHEYAWIGPALADALSLRVHRRDNLNAMTTRQVNAAMRHDAIASDAVFQLDKATQLGRQLGADVLVVGSYTAAWPDIELVVKMLNVSKGTFGKPHLISGGLDTLLDVEARIARALAMELGAANPDIEVGAFGTDSMRAWRAATLGFGIVNWQSLSPRSADANAPLKLPAAAIKEALGYFTQATHYDPDYGDAWAGLGVAQVLLGETAMAWRSLGKATALGFGHHPTAVLGASFVRMREGNWDAAAKILHSAIKRHPGFVHARGYLGQLYNHQGRHREALSVFTEYGKVVPRNPWVLAQRGYTKAKMRDHIGAISDTIAAVDMLPNSASLLLELAGRYIDGGKFIGAEDALLHALKMHPQESSIYVRLGYVYLMQGKDELVIPITEKAFVNADFGNNRRNEAYAHVNLVRAYGHRGDAVQALRHLKKARQIDSVSLNEIERDPKLRELRKDPRYVQIMQ